ncbi:hypothetical protein ACWATR_34985 [Nostoc sp. UIC 10890]
MAHEQITPLKAKKPPLLYLVIQSRPTQTFPPSKKPATATITVTSVEIPELTEQEIRVDAFSVERSHQSGVFEWAGGVGAEVSGVVGEAEPGLFYRFGREAVGFD